MFGKKKINLLPAEYKSKIISRYLIISGSCIGGIFAVLILGMLIYIGVLNLNIGSLNKQNTEYNTAKAKIADLEKQITSNQNFLTEQKKDFFGFYSFMDYLEYNKPEGLTIISVESVDRMVLPEKKENEENAASSETAKQPESTDEIKDTATNEADKKSEENNDDSSNIADDKAKKEETKSAKYEKDLSGEKIVLRGFAKNTQDISKYIYKLSSMPEISNITLSGIEEQVFNVSEKITIFEAVLEVR